MKNYLFNGIEIKSISKIIKESYCSPYNNNIFKYNSFSKLINRHLIYTKNYIGCNMHFYQHLFYKKLIKNKHVCALILKNYLKIERIST